MDAIERLEHQHGRIEDLFHEITLARDLPIRCEILGELGRELIAHVALEERLIHRAAARAPREAGLWDDWESRLRVERVAVALADVDPRGETFDAKIEKLQDLFEERLEYEETQLFPKLRQWGEIAATADVAPAAATMELAS
ncbi:MAG TPA: hemerythrin domain-containing protein [Polyangia bacterium]|nr:hemerythrin domain-containing protein [Polyangia bacterium]